VGAEAANVQVFGGLGQSVGAAAAQMNDFGATVAAPYQALVSNTTTNLQSLNSSLSANPSPFLRQVVANENAFGQTVGNSFQSGISNLPSELSNLPASIQAGFQGVSTSNPGAGLQEFITTQNGYGQVVTTSL